MSMLVVGVTESAVLFAVDSRQYPSREDTVKKLFLVGKRGMLGHSGIGVIPSDEPQKQGSWDAAREVERIAGQVLPVLPAYPKDQFAAIGDEVLASLNAGLSKRSLSIEGQNPRLTIMFVDRDDGGRVFLARKEFRVISEQAEKGSWRHHAEEGETQVILDRLRHDRGLWWDAPPECPIGDRKPTAPTPAAFAAFINEVAGQSPLCAQKIGGPIRVATIDSGGARWLQ
jgi:hypothetical protein